MEEEFGRVVELRIEDLFLNGRREEFAIVESKGVRSETPDTGRSKDFWAEVSDGVDG